MFSEKQYEEYKKKNPHKVKAAHKGFTEILAKEDMDEMYDPASIMAQAKGGSIEGYKALYELENGEDDGMSRVKGKSSASVEGGVSAFDVFNTPHGLGTESKKPTAAKAITSGV